MAPANSPCNRNPGSEITVIMNLVLGFKAHSIAEGDVRPQPPVILKVEARVEDSDRHGRYGKLGRSRRSVDGKLKGLSRLKKREVLKGP